MMFYYVPFTATTVILIVLTRYMDENEFMELMSKMPELTKGMTQQDILNTLEAAGVAPGHEMKQTQLANWLVIMFGSYSDEKFLSSMVSLLEANQALCI